MNEFQKHKEELKRDFAMYWGCPVKIKYKRRDPYYSVVDHTTITLLSFPNSLDYIMLVLRPLSDMTKEEAREFIMEVLNFRSFFFRESDFNYEIKDGFLSIKATCGNTPITDYVLIKNWGKEGKGEWIFNMSYTISAIKWCIAKGFDIFGYIGKGQAIDKTTILNEIKI
jgi:hypothetical protein